jgi:hypothetical protein
MERDVASREVSLAGLQVWQALTERVSGRPANPEVTLVFTDLVGFSEWSLGAGDDATLRLLRRVAQVMEPPLLATGGRIVKRMGDGAMAVFSRPTTAVKAVLAALEAVKTVEIDGYTPRMRAGVHTGRPQRMGSDRRGRQRRGKGDGPGNQGRPRRFGDHVGADPRRRVRRSRRDGETHTQATVRAEDRRGSRGSGHVPHEDSQGFAS